MKRTLVALLVTLTLTTVLFAQRGGRMGPPPDGQMPDRTAALKEVLNVTDAQIDAIKALQETRRQRAEAIFTEIEQKREALNTLLGAASPDATAVGNAAIALRASENKLKAEQDWFLTELKKLLTGEQQTTLDNLIAARSQLLGILGLGGPGGFGPGPGGRGRGRGQNL